MEKKLGRWEGLTCHAIRVGFIALKPSERTFSQQRVEPRGFSVIG